jgi:hypothetical protein
MIRMSLSWKNCWGARFRNCGNPGYEDVMDRQISVSREVPDKEMMSGNTAAIAAPEGAIWPNFFIVGASKCGTTSLYAHLKRHPQVFVPEVKEPNYFSTDAPPGEPILPIGKATNRDEYERLFQDAQGYRAIGDMSTAYLWDPNVPGRIRQTCPDAKIIIMLRDPVMRAHSQYLMYLSHGDEPSPSLWEALQADEKRNKTSRLSSFLYLERGLYCEQVRRYFDTFGEERVLVLLFDDLVRNPDELFAQVARHIGVDPALFGSTDLSEAHNTFNMARFMTAYKIAGYLGLRSWLLPQSVRTWLRRSPWLFGKEKPPVDDASRRFLQRTYDSDIRQLEDLLGRKLPELRKSWV